MKLAGHSTFFSEKKIDNYEEVFQSWSIYWHIECFFIIDIHILIWFVWICKPIKINVVYFSLGANGLLVYYLKSTKISYPRILFTVLKSMTRWKGPWEVNPMTTVVTIYRAILTVDNQMCLEHHLSQINVNPW